MGSGETCNPFPPTCTACLWRSPASSTGGAVIGFFLVKFVGGRVGVGTLYLPPPRLSKKESCAAPGVCMATGWRGGEAAGKIGAPSTPCPSLGTTLKKIVVRAWRGRGGSAVEGTSCIIIRL